MLRNDADYVRCREQINNLDGLIDGCHDDELGEQLTPVREFLAALLDGVLKQDFLEWSGGTAPESLHQISVYINNAMPRGIGEIYAAGTLRAWMDEAIGVRPGDK